LHAVVAVVLNCPVWHMVHCVEFVAVSLSATDPGGQSAQLVLGTGLYRPLEQAVQVVPPGNASVSVCEPAGQLAQLAVGVALNLPGAHWRQLVAPALASVLVAEPAEHEMQVALPEAGLYFPARQLVHAAVAVGLDFPASHLEQCTAPALAVSMTEPGEQTTQSVWPALFWYWPGAHLVHETDDTELFSPALHAVHAVL
jgi:hypothetical protein